MKTSFSSIEKNATARSVAQVGRKVVKKKATEQIIAEKEPISGIKVTNDVVTNDNDMDSTDTRLIVGRKVGKKKVTEKTARKAAGKTEGKKEPTEKKEQTEQIIVPEKNIEDNVINDVRKIGKKKAKV